MIGHTPGPWKATPFQVARDAGDDTDEPIDTQRIRTADGSEVVADVYGLESFASADARLMAAAPDLLAACEDVLSDPDCDLSSTAIARVRAAVAKAIGATS